MSTLTEQARTNEWLKNMYDRGFCLESGLMDQNNAVSGAAGALYTGDLLRYGGSGADYIAISASTGADCVAILMEDMTAAENAVATTEKLVLVRGPALIDSDNVVTTESATQKAAAITALAALDIRVSTSGDVTWSTQTT
jgi:hypothetical protein